MWKYKIFSIVVLMFVGGTHCAVRVSCQGSMGRDTTTNSSRSAVPSGPRSTPLVAVPVKSDGSKDFPRVKRDNEIEGVIEGVHHIAKFGIYIYKVGDDGSETMIVWKVDPSGPAARAGINKSDVITRVNGKTMDSYEQGTNISIRSLIAALRLSGNGPAKFEIANSGKSKVVMVTPLP